MMPRFTKKLFALLPVRVISIVTLGVFFRAVAGLLFAKLAAAFLGPIQYALYGHYYIVSSYLVTASSFGLASAFTVYVARRGDEDSVALEAVRSVVSLGTVVGFVVAIFLMGLFALDPHGTLLPKVEKSQFIWWFIFTVVAASGGAIQAATLGRRQHARYQLMTLLNPVISCIALLVASCVVRINPQVAILTYMLGFAIPILMYILQDRRLVDLKFPAVVPLLRFCLPFLLPSLLTPTIGTVSVLVVRHLIASNVSITDLGLWQALWRLSEGYMGALMAVGSALFIPQFSQIRSRRNALRQLTYSISTLIFLYLPLAISFLITPRIILRLFLSDQFTGIAALLPTQVAGDILKIICFLLGLFFTCIVRPSAAFVGELLFSAFFVLLAWLVVSHSRSTLGAVQAYFLSYCIVFCCLIPVGWHCIRRLPV